MISPEFVVLINAPGAKIIVLWRNKHFPALWTTGQKGSATYNRGREREAVGSHGPGNANEYISDRCEFVNYQVLYIPIQRRLSKPLVNLRAAKDKELRSLRTSPQAPVGQELRVAACSNPGERDEI